MKIVALVKYVPDANGERGFAEDFTVDRECSEGLLSELDEYAVEQALGVAEARDEAEVIALTLGPDEARDAVKRALQMGADSGIHVNDDRVHGSDALSTGAILAAAIGRIGPDLVVCGMSSTDGYLGVLPGMLAEHLGWAGLTNAHDVTVNGATVRIHRDDDTASVTLEAALPAVVSVTDQSGEPRYPSMKGILGARKKPVDELTLDDLGVDPAQVGLAAARTRVTAATARPPKQAGPIVIDDEGSGADAVVDFLTAGAYR
ncbi:MAG TPA: electron transfer flavoprotein subunit beta/FixA family protein [Candidatus Avipropionibacterium avicola]|uniref:Electron transfer flavoprotein subunit beta n=1 Tax=Candidatus Avipropionibacterium avicola TaxID=2840701 RepID=A0A9D1GYG2_9ACTN|nr:electron transfer flavoprotein subunit beta/FixA family protein [Candidatus Avipropionibacterium avicola]